MYRLLPKAVQAPIFENNRSLCADAEPLELFGADQREMFQQLKRSVLPKARRNRGYAMEQLPQVRGSGTLRPNT